MDITFIQSADPFRYRPMLEITASNVTAFCDHHGHGYESYVGIKRGRWPWQASYNRLFQFRDLIDRGFRGWAIHMDADAWINDPDFDLRAYLSDKGLYAAIMAEAGVTRNPWDINNGVMFVNLGHELGRDMIAQWLAAFLALPEEEFLAAREWIGAGNDQDLLQQILKDDARIGHAVLVESQELINSRRARFIRQHLRSVTSDLGRRIANIAIEVEEVSKGKAASSPAPVIDDRTLYSLRRSNSHEIALIEAPRPAVDAAAVGAAISHYASYPSQPTHDHLADLRRALEAGDEPMVSEIFATFGRSRAGQGHLGGAQQHERASRDRAFASMRALRTKDALTSLAEATGALAFENPEHGLWGFNVQRPAAEMLRLIGDATGMDTRLPVGLGSYLGIDAAGAGILHLRMIEAMHSAWRIRQVQSLFGLTRVLEFDGGVGFRALFAARLGATDYTILDNPVFGAVQAYLLGANASAAGRVVSEEQVLTGTDLVFHEETLADQPREVALHRIRLARRLGARMILSVGHEAKPARDRERETARQLVAEAGGYRLVQRSPHAVRPGFVEELFAAID